MLPATLTTAISLADAGFTVIKLDGKKPVDFNWTQAEYRWSEEVEESFRSWEGNYGIVIDHGWLVIDCDPRNYDDEDNPVKRLAQDCKINFRKCGAVSKTGGGGYHIFLKVPKDLKIKEIQKKYKGLEFKTKGRQVVGPGSIHPDTRKPYLLDSRSLLFSEIEDAPKSLLDIISRPEVISEVKPKDDIEGTMDDNAVVEIRYKEYLLNADAAVQGDRGDATTYAAACKGHDFGLSQEKALALMLEHYNPRCTPEWDPADLREKIRNAFSYSTGSYGQALPTTDFKKVEAQGVHPLWTGWKFMANSKLLDRSSIKNIRNWFLGEGYPLRDSLRFNSFSHNIQVVKPLPWRSDEKTLPIKGRAWDDDDMEDFQVWLSAEKDFDVKISNIRTVVKTVARLDKFHPVKDYLNGLTWDGKPRLDTWLIDYAGAHDIEMNREISRLVLMQAVERIYHPGCKADYMVVLEGKQGVGKSGIVKILGGEFYADLHIDPHNKDTVSDLMDKWIVEIPEMVSHRKSDADSMKAFITREVDICRMPYAATSKKYPRNFILIGTINPNALLEYFKDDSGNRRYLPIEIFKVKWKALEKVRDQLFAEAADRILSGEKAYITDEKVLKQLESAQKRRQAQDPWLDTIQHWLFDGEDVKEFVTTRDVWVWGMRGAEAQLKPHDRVRIATVLRDLGYHDTTRRVKGRSTRGYSNKEQVEVE